MLVSKPVLSNKKISMKIKSITVILFAGAILTGSCKKVLDKQPYSSFSDASAFASLDKVQQSLYGVYDAAQSGFYAGGAVRGYPFGAANIEQGDMRGEDMLNQATFYQITYEASYTNTSANQDYMFETLYNLINKANLTIDGIKGAASKGVISQTQGNQYEAECRFLRAMAHHELVLHYSRPFADNNGGQMGIIYRDFGVNSDVAADKAAALTRSTVKVSDTYAKILADLDFAEANLSAVPEVATYRASKAAAIALKMRVKMHMQDWAGVVTEGNKLVSGSSPYVSPINGYKLTATPDGPFTNNTSTENIFSIKNAATDNAGVNGGLAQMYGDPALGGRGLVRVSPIIWSDPDWKCDDTRRTLLYRTAGTTVNAVYTTKYKDYTNLSDAAPQIRYAEVLLTLAEGQARLSTTVSTSAIGLLNAVRGRATAAYTIASFLTPADLVKAILKERRIEFLAEGKRWGDISRLALDPNYAPVTGGGIPAKVGSGAATAAMFNCAGATVTKSLPAIPYADNRFIWPIPLTEIQQNPNYNQNPGY
jgi:starch-binding outer membrane protein, SusD/RagB family